MVLPVTELGPTLELLANCTTALDQRCKAYRISKHDIDATQLLNRFLHSSSRFVRVRHVCLDDYSFDARLLTLPLNFLRWLEAVEVVDRHITSFFREGR